MLTDPVDVAVAVVAVGVPVPSVETVVGGALCRVLPALLTRWRGGPAVDRVAVGVVEELYGGLGVVRPLVSGVTHVEPLDGTTVGHDVHEEDEDDGTGGGHRHGLGHLSPVLGHIPEMR